ncbi:MAG: CoA-binding protein [Betaproteobacteria bacterium]|nr:CoA-binding protein [Betaproteobacteria bacterium]
MSPITRPIKITTTQSAPTDGALTDASFTDAEHILRHCRTVAVVGLSPKPERDSFRVAHYMQSQGWRIVPVNPMVTEPILGEPVFANLLLAAQHVRIELVNCFRQADEIPAIVADALAVQAQALWMQKGIEHPAAAASARAGGLKVVQNQCLMVEYARWRELPDPHLDAHR